LWSVAASTGPAPRNNMGLAYDAQRGRLVMFGGTSDTTRLGDTWEWSGLSWSQVSTTGPAARRGTELAYDSDRHVVVLFGGQPADQAYSADTWEWNGVTWSLRATGGPPARHEHAMVFDSSNHRVVLFGGYNGGRLGDTWAWDGTAWSQMAATGAPTPRNGHAMAFDSVRGVAVLVGGYDGLTRGDTWELNGSAWVLRTLTGPAARDNHRLAFDPVHGRTLLYGGMVNGISPGNDLWAWDGVNWTQRPTGGIPRTGLGMDYDSQRSRLVVFGGLGGSPAQSVGDTWTFAEDAITTQPLGSDVCYRAPASFAVVASASNPSYQWQLNGSDLIDGSGISGSHTATLSIASSTLDKAGSYRAVVTTGCSTLVSQAAALNVHACSAPVFVKAIAAPGGNGATWATAIRDLNEAVQLADLTSPHPEVWVSRGTYKVDSGTHDRSLTLHVGGLTLYGGFLGNETQLSQRNWILNPCVISADILGNNVPGSIASRAGIRTT
jgi:hypothetical protein